MHQIQKKSWNYLYRKNLKLSNLITKSNRLWCLWIIIFSTIDGLKLLTECDEWRADGTFDSALRLFSQFYTVHVVHKNKNTPCIFGLLTNKSSTTFIIFFDEIKKLALRYHNKVPTPRFFMMLLFSPYSECISKSYCIENAQEIWIRCLVLSTYPDALSISICAHKSSPGIVQTVGWASIISGRGQTNFRLSKQQKRTYNYPNWYKNKNCQ